MELNINIEDYVSENDIRQMCRESVRSYIDKQVSQFKDIKDFISEAVYGSVSGEFLKVIFQENPEAVDKALHQLRKISADMDFISSRTLFGYEIEPTDNDRYYRPAVYKRASYINELVREMLENNKEALKEEIKKAAFERVKAATIKEIENDNLDVGYMILDALRKGLNEKH